MIPETEGTHEQNVQNVEKEQEQTTPEEQSSATTDRAVLGRKKSIIDDDDDDDEGENDIEDTANREDEKNLSILDDVVEEREQISSSVSGLQLADSNEWENSSVQQQNCPTCQDPLQLTTGCEDQLVEQFQFVSACRYPRDFLTIFQDHADSFDGAEHAVAGFYYIPKECEYCGAASTKYCPDHCTRPKSFFQRKRPPFCAPGKTWDSKTDIAIVSTDNKDKKAGVDVGRSPLRSLLLFGR